MKTRIAFLICMMVAGQAWGQTYDKMGDSCLTANNNTVTFVHIDSVAWLWDVSDGYHYTASAGDTVTMFKAWTDQEDSLAFGLYEFDLVGDTPTVFVFADTLVRGGVVSGWDSLSTKYGLTSGKSYIVAIMAVGSSGQLRLKGNSGTNADTLTTETSATGAWPSSYDTSNDAFILREEHCCFARVAQYGGGEAADAVVIGPTVIGPTVIGP
jgi:hypothetical protein